MKRTALSLWLLLGVLAIAYSQTNIDSLENIVTGKHSETEKIKALNILSYEYLFTDKAKAEACMIKLEEIAKKTSDMEVRAEAYRAIADQYADMEDYSKSIEFYRKSRDLLKGVQTDSGEKIYARTLLHMAIVPHIHGDFNEALLLYSEAEPLLEKHNQNRYLINLYNRKCDIFEQLKQNKQAMVYVIKAMKLSEEMNDPENLVRSMFTYTANSGNSARNIGYLKKAYALIEQHQLPDWLKFYYHFNYGGELVKLGKHNEALTEYDKAEKMAFDTREKMGPLLARINIYIEEKQVQKAKDLIDQTLKTAREMNMKVQIRDLYQLQIQLDSMHGNFKDAYLLILKKNELNDSLLSEETRKRVDYLDAKYQSAHKEKQIDKLQNEKRMQQLWILISAGGTIMLIVILVIIWLFYKKKQQLAASQIEQLKKEKQLAATQAVLTGETTERTRISRELHDGLGGLLSGTKLILNNMKNKVLLTDDNVHLFDHALGLLDNSINELRRVAFNMMPENLYNLGLSSALTEFCNGMNQGTGTMVHFFFFGTAVRFELNKELIMFRIAQELVNNSLKHSGASEINMQLVQDNDRISLSVHDNGIGFDPAKLNEDNSSGFRNIRSRVDSLGGVLSIDSEPGKGSEITIEINL
jgi:two-component system NarL family sensor kinase